jgi:hypothetical protein
MAHPFLDGTLGIEVALRASLAIGVGASIHRIGEDVVEAYRAMHNVTGGKAIKTFKM